jgi:DNA-binding transcriptional LysR family regulator
MNRPYARHFILDGGDRMLEFPFGRREVPEVFASHPARSDFEHEDRPRRGIIAGDDAGSFVTDMQEGRLDPQRRNAASYRAVAPAHLEFGGREDAHAPADALGVII